MLKIENLSTSYKTIDGDVHVLKDINFEIKDNEIFGIAGESGCGKTTLLNTLYDIVDYPLVIDQGRVVLEGEKTERNIRSNPERFETPGGTISLMCHRLHRVF